MMHVPRLGHPQVGILWALREIIELDDDVLRLYRSVAVLSRRRMLSWGWARRRFRTWRRRMLFVSSRPMDPKRDN